MKDVKCAVLVVGGWFDAEDLEGPYRTFDAIRRFNPNTPATLDDTGNANPDFDFRYDSSLPGYVFNLSTKGYARGTYMLNFTVGLDPATHSASFAVN